MSLARQGEKQREVCKRTVLLTRALANASAMPSYSPAHFSPAAKRVRTSERKKEREVTTA